MVCYVLSFLSHSSLNPTFSGSLSTLSSVSVFVFGCRFEIIESLSGRSIVFMKHQSIPNEREKKEILFWPGSEVNTGILSNKKFSRRRKKNFSKNFADIFFSPFVRIREYNGWKKCCYKKDNVFWDPVLFADFWWLWVVIFFFGQPQNLPIHQS